MNFEKEVAKKVAKDLLSIGAIFFRPEEPFIWASGIKSPIYCDNRLILTCVKVRERIENSLCTLVSRYFPEREILMGTSTAGIGHAAICAHILGLPMGYVRSGSKDHGRGNQIEGKLIPGQKTVVIEDLISTGGSAVDTVKVLRNAGASVLGIVSIFTYNMQKGFDKLRDAGVTNHSLTNFDIATEVAAENGLIKKEDVDRLILFRNNPEDESWIKR